MCQPVALYQPIALPPDFDGIDMIALAKTAHQPCERCGRSGGVIVRDGGVFCEHCGFNSQPRVAAKLKHRRRIAAKVKRERRAAAERRPVRVRVMPMPTSTRPREHRAASRGNGGGRDGSGKRDDGGGGGDDDGGGGSDPPPPPQRSRAGRVLERGRQP